FTFKNIWALDQPPLAESTITGQVSGVTFANVKYGQEEVKRAAQVPLATGQDDDPPKFQSPSGPRAAFTWSPQVIRPGVTVTFTAKASPHTHFTWLFGDGEQAHGRRVKHRYRDAEGTELNGAATGAGRFRVLLEARDGQGRQDWAGQGLVVVARWNAAADVDRPTKPGLGWKIYPGAWMELPDLTKVTAVLEGESEGLTADSQGFTRYAAAWDGRLKVPENGGYTFHLMARDGARLVVDGVQVAKTGPPFSQVCGSPGNAVRYDHGSIGLRAGLHRFHLEGLHSASASGPRLLWEGPGVRLSEVPASAYQH
ncbi:MAG TPA: PA14 domain-containing protein, partial [Terracidiphilus sp.]|nr:PA14 domain-containing protein [Terracidiphilus sp.]